MLYINLAIFFQKPPKDSVINPKMTINKTNQREYEFRILRHLFLNLLEIKLSQNSILELEVS